MAIVVHVEVGPADELVNGIGGTVPMPPTAARDGGAGLTDDEHAARAPADNARTPVASARRRSETARGHASRLRAFRRSSRRPCRTVTTWRRVALGRRAPRRTTTGPPCCRP